MKVLLMVSLVFVFGAGVGVVLWSVWVAWYKTSGLPGRGKAETAKHQPPSSNRLTVPEAVALIRQQPAVWREAVNLYDWEQLRGIHPNQAVNQMGVRKPHDRPLPPGRRNA